MRYRFTLNNDVLGSLTLPRNPGGWRDMYTLFKRSPKYHGFFYEKTINLEFYCGSGKEYIDQVLDEQGIDAEITLLIETACGCEGGETTPDYSDDYSDDYGSQQEDDCIYREEYVGKLSLKTWSTINGRDTVVIIQDSIADTVINRMDTVVDLTKLETLNGTVLTPLDYGPYEMDMHSKEIIFLSELSNTEDTDIFDQYIASDLFPPSSNRLAIALPLLINKDELDSISEYVDYLKASDPFTASFPDTLYTAFETGTYTIEYNLIGSVQENYGNDRDYYFRFAYRVNDVGVDLDSIGPTSYIGGVAQFFTLNYTGTLSLNLTAGDTFSLFLYIDDYTSTGSSLMAVETLLEQESYIRISKKTTTAPTTANVHAVFEAGARIAQYITDQEDAFRSEYFGRKNSQPYAYDANGCGSFTAITNGALLRNFPLTERPVRISLNEYYESLNAIHNLGLGIETVDGIDYIRVEPKSHFYSDTLLFQLINVPNIKTSVAEEYYHNRFEVGYEKWQIEQKGGIDEVNSKRQYDLGLKTIDNPLVAISSMIAGGYPLEIARRKQFPSSFTEDAATDNDNFAICLNQSVDVAGVPNNLTTAEKDENFDSVTNVLSPETSYNLRISPGRNTLRWSSVLNVGLLKYPGRNYKFTYGEGNFKMVSDFTADSCPGNWNNTALNEGQDIQWDDSDNLDQDPLWEPFIATLKYPLNRTQAGILKANPNGYIEISEGSTTFTKWYILEAKYNLVGGNTEFKLLKKWES